MPRRPRRKQTKSKLILPAPEDIDQDAGWYIIKDIIDEKKVRGKIEYLVDWENNPQTGEIYDPTWTKSRDVSKEARKEWEAKKLANKQKATPDKGDKSKLVTDCDDQTPKPEAKTCPSLPNTKPKRTASAYSTSSGSFSLEDLELERPPRKKTRLGFSSSPIGEATPSFVSTTSRGSVEQTSEEVETPRAARTFLVEFKKGPDFDPSEYLSTHGASQTNNSSQPLAKPESSSLRQSCQTIPDSQDPASLNTPVSEPSPVPERPRSQLPPLLIPDSQNETQESDVATRVDESQQQNIASVTKSLSDHSNKEKSGSAGTTCDIPSHQVNVQNDELQVSQTETVAQVSSSWASRDTPDRQFDKTEKFLEPESLPRQSESTLEDLAPVSPGSVKSLSAELPSELPFEEPNSRLSQAAQAPLSPLESVTRGSSPSAGTGVDRPSPPVEEVRSEHFLPQNSTPKPLNKVDYTLDENSEDHFPRASQEGKVESIQGDAAYASAIKFDQEKSGGRCSLAEPSSPQAIGVFGQDRESSTNSAKRAEDKPNQVAGSIETAAEEYVEAHRVSEEPRPTSIQRSLLADHTQEWEEARRLSSQSRRSRLSAAELVRDVIEHWDQPNYDPMSSNMFSEGPDDSDSGKRVSAVAELQSLWDVEPVHEPTQSGIEPGVDLVPASEPALTTTADVHRDLVNQANPVTQEIPFFSQPQGQIASWTPELSTDLSHIGGGTLEAGRRSATQTMQDLINQTYGSVDEPVDEAMLHPAPQDVQPATVSPADVSQPTEAEKVALPVLPLSSQEGFASLPNDISGNSITMAQVPQMEGAPSSSASSTSQSDSHMQHIVTIPFQASIRSLYHETLNKYRQAITDFGEMFTTETWEEPDPSLVQKIDSLFIELQNLCDFPEDILEPSVRDMPTEEKVKYSLNASSKLTFIYELLHRARATINVLIVARSPTILRMLCEMAEFSKLECTCDALEYKSKESFRDSPAGLTLVLPTGAARVADYDVVIGYDSSFDDSVDGRELGSQSPGSSKPLVLRLVTAYSIEHISLEIPATSNELERRNAMLFAMVYVRSILRDPPRLMEPHKVAAIFSDYLNNETEQILWEPVDIPPLALEVFANSQNATQMPPDDSSLSDRDSGRKRRHDDDHESDNKRQRVYSQTQPSTTVIDTPPMGDQLKGLLESVGYEGAAKAFQEGQLSFPLSVLEAIAEKVAEGVRVTELNNRESQYKETVTRLEKQVKEFEKTNEQFYESQREALQDRTKFQADARKAEEALQASKQVAKVNDEKAQKKILELEEANARLMKDSPAGANETLLQEANAKVQVLERRLETSHRNEEYTRQLYQDATGATSAMRAELQEVKELNEDLKKKASENLRNIHEINNNDTARELVRQVSELQARLKDREIELDRVREELRQIKNGRRETRQASVPRSPRMGMMSPRTARPFGASSRAGSPVPVMGSFESPAGVQTGNGRFSHLRE